MQRWKIAVAVTTTALLGLRWLEAESTGGAFSIAGNTAGGGGRSSGGNFTLGGVVSTSAGGKSTGGAYVLGSGFWGVVVVPSADVTLEMSRTESGMARLAWPLDAVGYRLETAVFLGPTAIWSPVSPEPTDNVFLTPLNQPLRFFRLKKP